MKKNFRKNIAMVLTSLMMASAFAVIEPSFNEVSVYASTYTHEDLVISAVPENITTRVIEMYYTDIFRNELNISDGLVVACKDFLYGYIDINGNEVIPCKYNGYAFGFTDGLGMVKHDNMYGYVDTTGKEVIPLIYDGAGSFHNGFAVVLKDGSTGIINTSGELITPLKYGIICEFSEGLALVENSGAFGFVDTTGAEVIPCTNEFDRVNSFSDGLAVVYKDGKYGCINTKGELVIPLTYDYISSFTDGLAAAGIGDNYGYIDKTGAEVIPFTLDNSYGYFLFDITVAGTYSEGYGLVNKNMEKITPSIYNYVEILNENIIIVGKDRKYGVIDNTGKEVIPLIYDNYVDYSEGLFVFLKDSKYGFVDETGKEVVPFIYEYIEVGFSEGVALVEKDGQEYLIRNPLTNNITPSAPTTSPTPAETTSPKVSQTNSAVLINGKQVEFQAYNIDGNNYFKLRDIAEVLKGTEKQFDVSWNNDKQAIELTSNKTYTTVGGELISTGTAPNKVSATSSSMYIDGKSIDLQAYNIDDNNYFKLRDLGGLFNFGVSWDGTNNLVIVDTSQSYSE